MKTYFSIFLVIFLVSCKDQNRSKQSWESENNHPQDTVQNDVPPGNIQEERDALQTSPTNVTSPSTEAQTSLEGRYIRQGSEAGTGSSTCSSIHVTFERSSTVCLDTEDLLISVRFEKTSSKTADVYFVEPQSTEGSEKNLPWEDFDKDSPVAELSLQPDQSLELDWIGFSIDGEIATDYALFGKKSLEGTYVKE